MLLSRTAASLRSPGCICDSCYASVNMFHGFDDLATWNFAHEIGHNFGAEHDMS